jgi:membrane protein implicated in regulation of membrane protease activity
MSLDKLVLILVCVIGAAGATLWLGSLLFAAWNVPFLGFALIPVGLVAYVIVRVIRERLGNGSEDHYDEMDH